MSGALIDTTEMYLKTVYELEEEKIPALRARIVDRLGQSGPTVSETVARLERAGLLRMGPHRQIQFTDEGFQRAEAVMRKHRLVECLLLHVIKLEWNQVHAEACRWEHVVSSDVAEKIGDLLGQPSVDPFGNPIPGKREGEARSVKWPKGSISGLDSLDVVAEMGADRAHRVVRIAERVQSDEAMVNDFYCANFRPGAEFVVVESTPEEVVLAVGEPSVGERLRVPVQLASGVYVS